ncbi:hypothetical protein Tco_0923861 [Tanacetum coccineum]|uniref:Uncharacterized protein n=1 Tax=Tanacetum coccineum TaxID=301880 RepID=A0ABQ5D3L8_9ASTR
MSPMTIGRFAEKDGVVNSAMIGSASGGSDLRWTHMLKLPTTEEQRKKAKEKLDSNKQPISKYYLRSVINELTSGEIVSLNFIESIKEARSRVQDLTSGEIVSSIYCVRIKEARSLYDGASVFN